MHTRDLITEKLRNAFAPESLHVEDESHRHEGHAGHRPGGETHFRLYIVSEAFRGKSRLERHRALILAFFSNQLQALLCLVASISRTRRNAFRETKDVRGIEFRFDLA